MVLKSLVNLFSYALLFSSILIVLKSIFLKWDIGNFVFSIQSISSHFCIILLSVILTNNTRYNIYGMIDRISQSLLKKVPEIYNIFSDLSKMKNGEVILFYALLLYFCSIFVFTIRTGVNIMRLRQIIWLSITGLYCSTYGSLNEFEIIIWVAIILYIIAKIYCSISNQLKYENSKLSKANRNIKEKIKNKEKESKLRKNTKQKSKFLK